MAGLLPNVDPDGLSEFSVVFTDRSLNHMSAKFQGVMREVSDGLKNVYGASSIALIPGGGTYAMEAVARQFATGRRALIVRNGWFSYRWTQIFDAGEFAADVTVVMARPADNEPQHAYAPPPIEEVVDRIRETRPEVVFAPHVETSAGLILPDDYIRDLAAAAHEVDALMVIDSIASGCVWLDMAALGIDVLISAPQKGWSASPAAGMVMMSERAAAQLEQTKSNSFALDLAKWRSIMAAYENGGHAYHATMPTDAIVGLRDAMRDTMAMGLAESKEAQWRLGTMVREMLSERGVTSVAARGFEAPGVVVCYTDDPAIQNGSKFLARGMQIAAGVPLQVNEGSDFRTFRIGLFGLDKLRDVDGTVARLRDVVEQVI